MLSAADIRRLDANSAFLGVPTTSLMEAAGQAVAAQARRMAREPGSRILILCGLGNNGGDGFVAARRLADEHEVTVLLADDAGRIRTELARRAREKLPTNRVRIATHGDRTRTRQLVNDSDLVIDALLGVGIRGKLRDPIRTLVDIVSKSTVPVLAVDTPTGLGADRTMRTTATVTFHDAKEGMTRANSGAIHIADIGIPGDAEARCGPGDLLAWWRPNAPGSHKGDNGRLLIVGGGPYGGAPLLSSIAAMRAGIDLVRLYTPRRVAPIAQTVMPDLILHWGRDETQLVPEDVDAIKGILTKVDAVLAGPGLGTSKPTLEALTGLFKATRATKTPLVLDADAIGHAGLDPKLLSGRPVLITPHAGEYKAFSGRTLPKSDNAVWPHIIETSKRTGTTILLKGGVDRITDGRRRRENHVHHSTMTRGGTGDVLAGVCAAFVARGAEPFEAACSAAFLTGATGARLAERTGHGTLASDIGWSVAEELVRWTAA